MKENEEIEGKRRGRPKTSSPRYPHKIYLSNKELEMLREERNLRSPSAPLSTYLREKLLLSSTQAPAEIDTLAIKKLLTEVNKIGVNMNQIAKVLNSDKGAYVSELSFLSKEGEALRVLRARLGSLLG